MPQRHQPESLEQLALKAVGSWVKFVGRDVINLACRMSQRDPVTGQLLLYIEIEEIKGMVFASPFCYIFDSIANQVLISVDELINEVKTNFNGQEPTSVYLQKLKIAVLLTRVAMHSQLKEINVAEWPKIMRHVLVENLSKLTGLVKLNLGPGSCGWDTTEMEKNILPAVSSMANLTTFCLCFDCTNAIITTVGNNCPVLKSLDIMSSRSVTNSGLSALYRCKNLRKVNLFRTSVNFKGFTDLLLKLPDIQNLSRCDDFGCVLEKLDELKSNPLSITTVQYKDISIDQLRLLVRYCPKLTNVSMLHYTITADITILKELQFLKDLKLLNCDFFSDQVNHLLECKGNNLESLHFDHVDEIDLNALILISQYCPKLKSLLFLNCEFSDHRYLNFDLKRLSILPFACLEKLVCVSDCAPYHLEFLMKYCKNVKFIQLSTSTGINDAIMSSILGQNPLKVLEELKILHSNELSMQSINLLMSHCDELRRISNIEAWSRISVSELVSFRDYIRSNNFNLDTTTKDYGCDCL